jgi:N-succinyldiaminopimelate aminotransferase
VARRGPNRRSAVPYTFAFASPVLIVNPRLSLLQPYPFERQRQWCADITPNPAQSPIDLSLGEPRRPTPSLVTDALAAGMDRPANYPMTIGSKALRSSIAFAGSL